MSATITVREVESLLNTYVLLEKENDNPEFPQSPEYLTVRKELDQCIKDGPPATLKLRNFARVLTYFCDDTHKKRRSTSKQFALAIDYVSNGLNVPKAIKKSRHTEQARARAAQPQHSV